MVRNLMCSLMVGILTLGMLLPATEVLATHQTILLVSDSDVPGGSAGTNNYDDMLVSFLEGLDYTVDTSGMNKAMREVRTHGDGTGGSGPDIAALNAADLVIVSRNSQSSRYDGDANDDATLWNSVSSPLLLMSGFIIQQQRWSWMVGNSGIGTTDATADSILVTPGSSSHPFVAGFPIGFSQVLDWTSLNPPEAPVTEKLAPSSLLRGQPNVAALFDGLAYAFDMPAGTDTEVAGLLGGKRAFLGSWAYPGGGVDFGTYTTANYDALLTNVINTLLGSGSLSGDFDGDLDVDGADFLAWQRGFGSTYGASDLDDWKGNYGATAAMAAITAVPEPATWILAWVMAMAAIGWRQRSFNTSLI